ncbi:cbb3-type cytochrome c oxidase subunit I, partial [Roseiarcus sp.]|uniref:cbb3-type cytochrome c oxidase subunit I n=1 Tax=Roseiarcus sp. TaxID=1969460 RepID=UPI003F97D745
MQTVSQPKSLWSGEIGLIAVLAILGLLCLYIAIKTIEPAYAFHMGLGFICAAIAIFAIFQRFNKRDAARPPLEINGLPNYNFSVVKFTTVMALFWGLAGMAVGVYIASELAFPDLNLEPWFNFGRLRPLHTSAVIFAFGGNVLLATSFYVVQRTCRARLAGDLAPWFVALGYNFFILIAGTGYLLGITESKEYAEPEWYADLWLTIV